MPDGRFISHDNKYLDDYANTPIFGAKKAKNYWGSILGAAKNGTLGSIPGMSMFDNQLAKVNDTLEHQSNGLATGPLADRVKQLNYNRQADDINDDRYSYAANQVQNAANGIMNIAQLKNSANAQKYGTLIGGENSRYQYEQKQPGFWSQFAGGLAGKLLG